MSKRKDEEQELKLLVIEIGEQIVSFIGAIDPKATTIDKVVTIEFLRQVFVNLEQIAEKIGLRV